MNSFLAAPTSASRSRRGSPRSITGTPMTAMFSPYARRSLGGGISEELAARIDKSIDDKRKQILNLKSTVVATIKRVNSIEIEMQEVEKLHAERLSAFKKDQEEEMDGFYRSLSEAEADVVRFGLLIAEKEDAISDLMLERRGLGVPDRKAADRTNFSEGVDMAEVRKTFGLYSEQDAIDKLGEDLYKIVSRLKAREYEKNPNFTAYWETVDDKEKLQIGDRTTPWIYSGKADKSVYVKRLVLYLDLDRNE